MISTLKGYFTKVRIWGLKGIWNFFFGKIEARRLRNYFIKNATKYPTTPAATGFTIVAPFHDNNSLSKVIRDLTFSLHDAGIPFQTFDTSKKNLLKDTDIDALITPSSKFQILKYANVIELFNGPVPPELGLKKSHIVFWEFESGLLETFPRLCSPDTIIAMSYFNEAYFRKILPPSTPVAKLIYPFHHTKTALPTIDESRRRFGIKQNDFVVFFNFDYDSDVFRKNPDGAMRAFAQAFPDNPNVKLIFKTVHSNKHCKEQHVLVELAQKLGIVDRFRSFDVFMPKNDVLALTNACDVYLSLHRGEGLGLGIAEAMSMGKPVVISGCGGPLEFCNSDNAILIPTKSIPLRTGQMDNPCYHSVAYCAEPDIKAAVDALIRLHEDKALRTLLGRKAKNDVEDHFSIEDFAKSARAFLKRSPIT